MSFIVHRCSCGHPDIFHGPKRGGSCEADDGCRQADDGPSELIPTFNDGRPVETVAEPGSRPNGYLSTSLCDCGQCVALYRQLTGTTT